MEISFGEYVTIFAELISRNKLITEEDKNKPPFQRLNKAISIISTAEKNGLFEDLNRSTSIFIPETSNNEKATGKLYYEKLINPFSCAVYKMLNLPMHIAKWKYGKLANNNHAIFKIGCRISSFNLQESDKKILRNRLLTVSKTYKNNSRLLLELFDLGFESGKILSLNANKKNIVTGAKCNLGGTETGEKKTSQKDKNAKIIKTFIETNRTSFSKLDIDPRAKENAMKYIYDKIGKKLKTGSKQLSRATFMQQNGFYHKTVRTILKEKQ